MRRYACVCAGPQQGEYDVAPVVGMLVCAGPVNRSALGQMDYVCACGPIAIVLVNIPPVVTCNVSW
jgi:hypothetical protein